MRDWTKLLPASFRGVAFYVESDEASGGRRLALHEYAGGEKTIVEDLGAATRTYGVTAYTLGDEADRAAIQLQQALSLPGSGLLTLPIDGTFLAFAQTFRRSRSKDKNGYIAFEVTFVPDALAGGLVLSLGDVTAAVAGGLAAAATALGAFF